MKIVCDIDGTLLYTHVEDGRYIVDDVNQPLIDKINKCFGMGDIVVLFTGRHWNHLEDTYTQVHSAGIKHHSIVCGKPPADVYIDDLGMRPDEFKGGL